MRILPALRACAVIGVTWGAITVSGRTPDWAQPLLAKDVTALGGAMRLVRLADTADVRFDNTGHVQRTLRGAMRVMTENGRTLALCAQGYNADTDKLVSAHAWIVSADGKRTESFGLSDFVDSAVKSAGVFWPQRRILTFNATERIEIKGVLLWEFEVRAQTSVYDFGWNFPANFPTLLSAIEVTPPPGGRLVWHAISEQVPQPTAGSTPGALLWEIRDTRPTGGDRPTGFLPTPRGLVVRAVGANGANDRRTWADIAKLADEIMEPRINSTSAEIKAKAAALVAGRKDRWDRIRALTEFVQKEVTYLGITLDTDSLAGYRPHTAAEVFQCRYGDCKDKATLLVAMLRAIGESGFPMLVFAGNPTAVLPDWPAPRFNHAIVCIPADRDVPPSWPMVQSVETGRLVVFDPTNPYTPLGLLPHSDQAGHGLVVASASADLVELPAALDHEEYQIDLTLDEGGAVAGKVVRVIEGSAAAFESWVREREGKAGYTKLVERRWHETMPALDAVDWTDSWNRSNGQWKLVMNLRTNHFATRSGPLLIVNPHIVSRARFTPWKTRAEGVVWLPGAKYQEHTRLVLPTGAKIEELPDPWHETGPQFSAAITYRYDGAVLECTTEMSFAPAFLRRDDYESVRTLQQNLENAQRRPIVLRLSAKSIPADK